MAVVAHQNAEEVGHVQQRGFGLLRIGAHKRQYGVDAVEQEMGTNPRLQRLQSRFGDGGRERLCPKPEVREQRAKNAEREDDIPDRTQSLVGDLPGDEREHGDGDHDRQCRGQQDPGSIRLPQEPRRRRIEDGKLQRQLRRDDCRNFRPLGHPQLELGLANHRRHGRQHIDGQHDAQNGAEIAEIRQFGSDGVLSYNRLDSDTGMRALCRTKCRPTVPNTSGR